jgi:hypothetical protein
MKAVTTSDGTPGARCGSRACVIRFAPGKEANTPPASIQHSMAHPEVQTQQPQRQDEFDTSIYILREQQPTQT